MPTSQAWDSLPESIPQPHRSIVIAAAEAWRSLLGERLISLVLFGSVARGEASEHSDIDVLMVAEALPRSLAARRRPLLEAWELARKASGLPAAEWNLVVKSPAEATQRSPLYLDLVEDALLLVDREDFFARVLAGMAERMRELGSRRVFLPDGGWYWDLKPDFRFGEVVEI